MQSQVLVTDADGNNSMHSLSNREAFRLLDRTGRLIHRLHGRPAVVVGIARSGTALGQTIAQASRAAAFVVIGASRVTSSGAAGSARSATQSLIPGALRRAYKSSVYPLAVKAAARQDETRSLADEDREALRSVLADNRGGPVVIIDDAIDTGKTVNLLKRSIEDIDPTATIITVALTSTIGVVCGPHQLSYIHGAHLHNSDGDPSWLHTDGDPIRCRASDPDPWRQPQVERLLYLDLDHTLCRNNTFSMAAAVLLKAAMRKPTSPATRQLVRAAGLRKSRAVDHLHLKQAVDQHIRSLAPEEAAAFQSELADRMRADVRPALLSVATAPTVRSAIVTAALRSYGPAIEQAFGIPVLCGAGPDSDGTWIEPAGKEKAAAIEIDRDRNSATFEPDTIEQGLMVGDAMADLLSAGPVPTALIPEWDSSGLATILAAVQWWDRHPAPA